MIDPTIIDGFALDDHGAPSCSGLGQKLFQFGFAVIGGDEEGFFQDVDGQEADLVLVAGGDA